MTDWLPGLSQHHSFYQPDQTMLPKVDWKPPSANQIIRFRDAKRVSLDLESKDEDLKRLGPGVRRPGNRVVGVSIAIEDGPEEYFPISHEGGDNCDWDVWAYLREEFKHFKGNLFGANLPYDLDWINQNGVDTTGVGEFHDVQVNDVLINELHDKYNLEVLCERHGLPGKDETMLRQVAAMYRIDPKKQLWRLPARYVAQYAKVDARRPLQVARRQEKLIASEGIENIVKLEHQITPILVKMRRRGIRIDVEKLTRIEEQCLKIEADMLGKVRHATGVAIKVGDVWKTEALAHALKVMGYKLGRTEKGKESVDKSILENCGEVGDWLLTAREWNKLRTTFAKQVREHLIGDRVHCTFHQLKNNDEEGGSGRGVRYGRFSSSDFNIQQQPVRNEDFGSIWRSIYIPDEGARWACSDWSQQEPRIAVHHAERLRLPGAREFADEYRRNPGLDIHAKLTELFLGVPYDKKNPSHVHKRTEIKNYVNGRLYGMGDVKLCRALKLPVERKMIHGEWREVAGPECQAIIMAFTKFAPWIPGLTRAAAKQARQMGFVWTSLRRKCRFLLKKDGSGEYDGEHKAFNRIGQGDAADQMKSTLVAADREGIPVQAVVHDEFDFSFYDIRVPRRLKELQESTVKFSVPMKVDLEIGPNWGELEKDAA